MLSPVRGMINLIILKLIVRSERRDVLKLCVKYWYSGTGGVAELIKFQTPLVLL